MPHFRIHMINSNFESCEEGEYPSLGGAIQAGIAAATKVASEAIEEGEHNSSIEIRVEEGDAVAARRVLTFSVSDLLVG